MKLGHVQRANLVTIDRALLTLLSQRRSGMLLTIAGALLTASTATFLQFALGELLRGFPLLIYFPAIFACAVLLNRSASILATILGAFAAAYFFVPPLRSFDVGFNNWLALALFVSIGVAISAAVDLLRQTIARLNDSEATQVLMFEELAHRTKNDLALISSALTLQSRFANDPAVRQAIEAANARVFVVAKAQDRLKGHGKGGKVDLAEYIGGLCNGLGDMLRDVRPIAVRVDCEAITVSSAVAVHVGLIVNELVTNSLKYAYPGENGGIITVQIRTEGSRIQIVVADDGIGCADDVSPGLGSKLVRLLAKQLGGSVVREAGDPGCLVRVTLEEPALSS